MTLTTTTTRVEYPGAGSAGPFSYPFRIFSAAHLVVTVIDAEGTETVLTSADYDVTGVGNKLGGTVTLDEAVAEGETLRLERVVPITQLASFRTQSSFRPDTHEDALDYLTMVDQQQQTTLDRAVRIPSSVDPADITLTLPAPSAGTYLGWNDDGDALENKALAEHNVVLPAEGRTVATLASYLANNAEYNAADYSMFAANTAAANAIAFNAAAAAVVAAGHGVVRLPRGTIAMDTGVITGSVVVRGWGVTQTTLSHTASSHGFNCTATGGAKIVFEDFTLAGPTGLGFDNTFWGINWTTDTTTSRLEIRRVHVTGTFEGCVQKSGGGQFIIDECNFKSTDVGVGFFESLNTPNPGKLTCTRTKFSTPDGDLTAGGSVGIYIHPHIPHQVDDCDFEDIGRYGIYQNGTPSAARTAAIISNCRFVRAGIVQSKSMGITRVVGCTQEGISGKGSLVDGTVDFVGCTFKDVEYVTEPYNLTVSDIGFAGCTFINSGVQAGGLAGTRYTFDDACRWRMTGTAPANNGRCVYVTTAGIVLRVFGEIVDESTTAATFAALYINGASCDARIRVRMTGVRASTAGFGQVYIGADPTRIDLTGSEFDAGASGNATAVRMVAGVSAQKVTGRDVRFVGCTVFHASSTQQGLIRREDLSPNTVASAASIALSSADFHNYNSHLVSGAAAIANLNFGYAFIGILRLFVAPGGSWSTANTGNILPKTTAARTAGEVVTLYWEPTAAKWLEV